MKKHYFLIIDGVEDMFGQTLSAANAIARDLARYGYIVAIGSYKK